MKIKVILAFSFILSGCLSSERVAVLLNTPLTVDSNTIALWNFDTDSGNTVADLAPNAAAGNATNTSLSLIPGIDPSFALARQFDGSTSVIDFDPVGLVSKLNFENQATITFEAMVYVDPTNSSVSTIFDNGQFQVKIIDGHLGAYVRQVGGWSGLVSEEYLLVSTPLRILVSFDAGNLGLSVDGVGIGSARTKESKFGRTHGHAESIVIGTSFKGYIDDVRISNISRSDVYAPVISLVSPDLSQPITTPRPNFTFSLSDVALESMWALSL